MNRLAEKETLDRITASRTFEKSGRLKDFLIYVASKSLEGKEEEISEQQIGVAVFRREAGFDPAQDAIVRVTARQLRAKLIEYYAGEGAHDEVILEIPKGAYVPKWEKRAVEPGVRLAPADTKNAWRSVALLLGAIMLAQSGFFAWTHWQERPLVTPTSILLLSAQERLKIVIADSALTLYRTMGPRQLSLADYLERRWPRPEWLPQDRQAEAFWETLQNRKDVSLSAVMSFGMLTSAHPEAVQRIEVRHPQIFHLRELGKDNLLLLGGQSALPWAESFQEGLQFRHTGSNFENLHPRAGEPSLYISEDRFGLRGKGFVRISSQINPEGKGRVVHIAGSSWLANELGMRYLTDPASVRELDNKLDTGWRNPGQRFELLLETQAVETAAARVRLLSWRIGYQ